MLENGGSRAQRPSFRLIYDGRRPAAAAACTRSMLGSAATIHAHGAALVKSMLGFTPITPITTTAISTTVAAACTGGLVTAMAGTVAGMLLSISGLTPQAVRCHVQRRPVQCMGADARMRAHGDAAACAHVSAKRLQPLGSKCAVARWCDSHCESQ